MTATGVRSRRLAVPGPTQGRYVVRTVDDSVALRDAVGSARDVVVVGAGFIGCEVAAVVRQHGCTVTVVAPESVPMERPLGRDLGRHLQRHHESHGVVFHLNAGVNAFLGDDIVNGVELLDGTRYAADLVVEAVGSVPNTEWLDGNGLDLSDGLSCDEFLRVEDRAAVAAVGDVARLRNSLYGHVAMRVEHWSLATDTARRAARTVLADLGEAAPDDNPFHALPTFWTHQFDIRLQSFGAPALGHSDIRVLDGDYEAGPVVVGYHRDDHLVGIVGTGGPKQLLAYRAALMTPAPAQG